MKIAKLTQRVLSILLVMSLVTALTIGCSKSGADTTSEDVGKKEVTITEASKDEEKTEQIEVEHVEFTILFPNEDAANDFNKYLDSNEIYKRISEVTNTSFEVVGWSDEKTKMAIAGGDIPDIVCLIDENTRILQDAGMLYDLEPLMEATNSSIMASAPERTKSAKEVFDDGKLWFITPNATEPDTPNLPVITNDVYPTMRWDYYKELGYPEINNFDDLLSVLEGMVENHPTTEDGKKVYGMASFTDWGGFWAYSMTTGIALGMPDPPQNVYASYREDETLTSNILDPESPLWQTALLMNKAQRKGLLHPDSFTMKFTDFEAAAVRGEILYGPTIYQMQKANIELAKQDAEFIGIPFNFGYSYFPIGDYNRTEDYLGSLGWSGKNWSITTNCEYPERAMELLNYCFSVEGSRLIKSGIEGVHWDYVDGVPQMKAEYVDLKVVGGEEWQQTCLDGSKGSMKYFSGFDSGVIHTDGYPVNLLATPSTYKLLLSDTQKDFCEYYDVDFPMEEWWNRAEEGILEFNADIKNVKLPPVPEEIKAINLKLEDIVLRGLPLCILEPTTDEEFVIAMNELMDELRDEEADISWEWAESEWEKARAEKYSE